MGSKVNKRQISLCLATSIAMGAIGAAQAQDVASVDEVPNFKTSDAATASAGQCYARVSIPAVYKEEPVKTEIRPQLARFKVTPPVFKDTTQSVAVSPAVSEITAIQPVIETQTQSLEILPASKGWVRGSIGGSKPLTAGELEELKGAGIDTANAAPGTCFYEHFSEATLEDVPSKIMISQATEELSVSDAVLKEELVTVTVVPAHTRMIEVPPSFKKGTEKVMVQPATKAWRTDCGAVQKVDHMTGETLCLVDVPAKFETLETDVIDVPALITNVDEAGEFRKVKTQVLVSDAKEVRKPIPAKFDSIDRQRIAKPARYSWLAKNVRAPYGAEATGRAACYVETPAKMAEYDRDVVKTAGRFETEKVPAKTETIKVKQLVAKSVSNQAMVEPKFKTVQRKTVVEDAKIAWQPVLCQVEFSTDIIVQLQEALKNRGYEPGPIDGVIGRGTSRALQAYQKANNMADGGVTIEALKKLGVKL